MLFFSFAKGIFITLQSILLPRLVVIGFELFYISLFVYIQFSGDFQFFLVYLLHFLYLLHLGLFLEDHLSPFELLLDLFSYSLSNIVLLKHLGPNWLETKAVILWSWGMISHFLRLAQWLFEWEGPFLWWIRGIVPKNLSESIIGSAVSTIEKGRFAVVWKLIWRNSWAISSLWDKQYLVYCLHRRIKISNIDELIDLLIDEDVCLAPLFRKNRGGTLWGLWSGWSGGLG